MNKKTTNKIITFSILFIYIILITFAIIASNPPEWLKNISREDKQNDAVLKKNFGDIFLEKKKYNQAIMEYEQSLEIKAGQPEVLTNMAVAYLELNKSDNALNILKYAIELAPENPSVINKGDFVFISGPSGVGKTTLFNCISGLDKIDEGHVEIMGFDIKNQPESLISDFRLQYISYITQHNNLFEPLLVEDNLLLPYLFLGKRMDTDYAKKIMKECFIDHKIKSYPDELSAGEKQRAALATSLVRKTSILIADEPTANLNSELARSIINLFMDIAKIEQKTVIVCSHDLSLLRPGFRHIRLSDGQIEEDYRVSKEQLQEIIVEYLSIQKNKNKESIA